jgi:hypothetical protein
MDEPTTEAVGWEPLEVLAACVLGAVTALVVGGLVGGIVGATSSVSDESGRQFVGIVIDFASGWGLIADAFLVVALAILWRQVRAWATPTDGEQAAGDAHFRRCRRLATWTGVLLLAGAGATMASFVSSALTGGAPHDSLAWERYIVMGGTVVASVLIAVGGLWVVRDLTNRCWAAEDNWAEDDRADDEPDRNELEDDDR